MLGCLEQSLHQLIGPSKNPLTSRGCKCHFDRDSVTKLSFANGIRSLRCFYHSDVFKTIQKIIFYLLRMTSAFLIFFETKSEHCCFPPVYVKALLNIQNSFGQEPIRTHRLMKNILCQPPSIHQQKSSHF